MNRFAIFLSTGRSLPQYVYPDCPGRRPCADYAASHPISRNSAAHRGYQRDLRRCDAQVVAETVATPIEQEVNGVEDMLYMSSQSTNSGSMALTIAFKPGTNLDKAQVLVQNRVSLAEPRLPEEVRRQGISVKKTQPGLERGGQSGIPG